MSFLRTSYGTALCVFAAGAALAFVLDHDAQVLQWLRLALG